MMESDIEFEIMTVESATLHKGWWDVRFAEGTGLGIEASLQPDRTIEPGQTVKLYGRGFGYPVRGIVIDDVVWRYETEDEHRESQRREHEAAEQKRRDEFEATGRAELDAKYAALPALFQQRIDRFRANNPDFRWKYEGYEIFTCEQAVVIADALKTVEALEQFHAASWDFQKERIPDLSSEHSGNTFGMACVLARCLIERPEYVVKMHGALTALVGCEEYGCDHPAADEPGAAA